MSVEDETLYASKIRVENKDLFIDLRKNASGVYLKLSERNEHARNTVLIPAVGIPRLKAVLNDVANISAKHVQVSAERKNRSTVDPQLIARSVYVSGLAWITNNSTLAAHFNKVCDVLNASVLYRSRGGRQVSLGCGIVEFANAEDSLLAVKELNDSELDGRRIKCREDRAVGESTFSTSCPTAIATVVDQEVAELDERKDVERVLNPTKVFVTSLPWATTCEEVKEIFSEVGEVISAEVLTTKKGRSLGHAVVEFTEAASVTKAIDTMNDREAGGRPMIVRGYYTV